MSATVSVNGRVTDEREAVISVFDHGFLYGEGIYETLRTYGGRPFLFDRHMRRLRRSAALISLPLPFSDASLAADIETTMKASQVKGESYIRVLVTRGIGDLSYDPRATPRPSVVIIVKPHEDPPPHVYRAGVRVVIVAVVRNHPDSVSPMIKSNNLMNSALAMQQAITRGGYEGIMRNFRGELTECAVANLFIVRGGEAITPPLSAGILPGITREHLFEIGQGIGVTVREETLHDADLFGADEAFLTGTTREVVPIVMVDDRIIGSGTPGPVTLRLLEAFRQSTR
jgi:branched-chain amino acid aminotransferase